MPTEWLPVELPSTLRLTETSDQLGNEIEVTRSDDGWLEVVGTSEELQARGGRPGTLVQGESLTGTTLKGSRVQVDGFWVVSRRSARPNDPKMIVTGRAESAAFTYRDGTAEVVTEWLENAPKQWIWPHSTKREGKTTRVRGSSLPAETSSEFSATSSDHVHLELDLPSLRAVTFGVVPESEAPNIYQPGFLEFQAGDYGLPDERLRRTVRRGLEFLFDRGLGVHGWTEATADGVTISTTVTSCHAPGGRSGHHPPALLHPRYLHFADAALTQDFLRRYVRYADPLGLNDIVWRLANSRRAPLDMKAGYIGGAFEALRRRYYEVNKSTKRTTWLPKAKWRELKRDIEGVVVARKAGEESAEIRDAIGEIEQRLGNLNTLPGTVSNELFLTDLGLEFGDVEREALKARNDAAHANPISPGEEAVILGRCRALQTVLARALLAAVGADLKYFDYSSLDYPPRELTQAMVGSSGLTLAGRSKSTR